MGKGHETMNTHRAYYGADTLIDCYIRNAAGPVALTSLRAPVYAYGRNDELTTLPASIEGEGKATLTVTSDATESHLGPGLYRFAIEDLGRVVYDGLLEIV